MSGQQHAPAALYPRESPVSILQEDGWATGLVWTGGKSRPHRDSIPSRPARSSVAIPTELPDPRSHTRITSKHTLRSYVCCVHGFITGVCVCSVQALDQINRLLRNLYERYANLKLLVIKGNLIPCTKMNACTTLSRGSSPLLMFGCHPELLQQEYQERHTKRESSYLSARGPLHSWV